MQGTLDQVLPKWLQMIKADAERVAMTQTLDRFVIGRRVVAEEGLIVAGVSGRRAGVDPP